MTSLHVDPQRDEEPGRPALSGENTPPEVKILTPGSGETVAWDSQIRYEISVSDPEDGKSRYGEIDPGEVLLEMEYLPDAGEEIAEQRLERLQAQQEPDALLLIRSSDCFSCHRDQTRLTGPSFLEMSQRYKPNEETLELLGRRIIEGSSGIWGGVAMPPHRQVSGDDARQMVRYILALGGDKLRRIYPGLEGVVRIMKRPADASRGVVILTASYTDHGIGGEQRSRKRGIHSVILRIK